MNLFILTPLILGTIVSVAIFRKAEKENEDYAAKIWLYIISILFAIITTLLTEKSIEYNKDASIMKNTYENIDYIY